MKNINIQSSQCIVKGKFMAYVAAFGIGLFAYGALIIFQNIFKIESNIYQISFFYFSLVVLLGLIFIKKLILFFKIWTFYILVSVSISIVLFIVFFLFVASNSDVLIKTIIYLFLILYISSLLYDSARIYKRYKGNKKEVELKLLTYLKNKNICIVSAIDFINFLKTYHQDETKTITGKFFIIFGIPFVVFGKGASYFFAIGIGEYLDTREYLFGAIGIIFVGFILIASVERSLLILGFKI